jgi:hypothetical protein
MASASDARTFQEYCGKRSHVALKPLYKWDCSGLTVDSMAALRHYVTDKYTFSEISKPTDEKIYESSRKELHYSAWVIYPDGKAVRYRTLYEGDGYRGYVGVGVTVFCTGTVNDCTTFEAAIASGFPPAPMTPRLFPHAQY